VAAALHEAAPDMVVIGRRQLRSNNSWMHNLPVLAKGAYRCTALIHTQDAARLGLRHGGGAQLRNGDRAIAVQVEIDDGMMPGVVSLPHGWGHNLPGTQLHVAAERPGVNLNATRCRGTRCCRGLPSPWRRCPDTGRNAAHFIAAQ
jgi:anaerobic selenocysteine-containing dehydrogenase